MIDPKFKRLLSNCNGNKLLESTKVTNVELSTKVVLDLLDLIGRIPDRFN